LKAAEGSRSIVQLRIKVASGAVVLEQFNADRTSSTATENFQKVQEVPSIQSAAVSQPLQSVKP